MRTNRFRQKELPDSSATGLNMCAGSGKMIVHGYDLPLTHKGAGQNIFCRAALMHRQDILLFEQFPVHSLKAFKTGRAGITVISDHHRGNLSVAHGIHAAVREHIQKHRSSNIAFIRMEAGTNLIGGQPFSLKNLKEISDICKKTGIILVVDASLLADNLHFIKTRESECSQMSINEITLKIGELADIIYFSARKLGCARGGGICTDNETLFKKMQGLIPLYEGFLTYGGISVREMEAIAVGIEETMDEEIVFAANIKLKAEDYMISKLKQVMSAGDRKSVV